MRLVLLASAACLLSTGALAQSMLGQSDPGGSDAAPPHASTPAPVLAQALAPPAAQPSMHHVAPPAALVAAPLAPPPEMVQKPSAPPKLVQSATPVVASSVSAAPDTSPDTAPAAAPDAAPTATTATSPAATTNFVPGTLPTNDVPPPPETQWVPATKAEIGVLNKVDGSTKILTIPVGGQAVTENVTVSVQSCMVRPPGALPNAALFVTLQTSNQPDDMPIYKGWVVRSVPGATDAETPDIALRLIGCS